MASANFTNLADHLARGQINFASDSFKFMLASSAPSTTNLDTWVNRSDVTNEASGTGYTAGGVAVTATVGAVDTTNNRVPVTFADLSSGVCISTWGRGVDRSSVMRQVRLFLSALILSALIRLRQRLADRLSSPQPALLRLLLSR